MSLRILQELAATTLDLTNPEVRTSLDEIRKRQVKFDEEIEAKVKAKIPSNELLNRVVNL